MTEEEIRKLLELHAATQDQIEELAAPFDAQIAEIEAKKASVVGALTGELADLRSNLDRAILTLGRSVKGDRLHAVYNKGRSGGWDTKRLEGLALIYTEINECRKPDGEPTVSLRKVN